MKPGQKDLTEVELSDLIARSRDNDSKALAKIFEVFYPKIYRYMYYRANSKEDAEDLSSEVFVKVIKSIQNQRGSFYAWIYQIAANLAADYYRRRAVRRRVESQGKMIEDLETAQQNPEDRLTHGELKKALSQLTSEQQLIIILKFMEGYGTEEISRMLGKSQGSVRALQFRGLSTLRKSLNENG